LRLRGVSGPAVRGNVVAVGDAEGYVHFLSREEGAFVGRVKSDGSAIRVPLQQVRGSFLSQSTGGDIRAIEIQ